MRKEYPEQVKEVAWAAWTFMNKEGKFLIVVDDDIDVRNPFEVEWAMNFRAQPAKDLMIAENVLALGLDPSTAPVEVPEQDPRRRTGSKVLIDATRKHTYPAPARVPEEHMDAVRRAWSNYGFK